MVSILIIQKKFFNGIETLDDYKFGKCFYGKMFKMEVDIESTAFFILAKINRKHKSSCKHNVGKGNKCYKTKS